MEVAVLPLRLQAEHEAVLAVPLEVRELQVETSAVDLDRQVSWEAASEVVS